MQGIYNYIPQTNTVLQLQTSNKHCFTITNLKQTLFYNYIPQTNTVPRAHSAAAVLYLQSVLHVMLFRMLKIL